MEWRIENINETGLVSVRLAGEFNVRSFPLVFEEIVSIENWFPGTPILFDSRELELKGISYSHLTNVSSYFERYKLRFGSGKIALLKKTLADFGIGRQFQLMTEDKVAARFGVFLEEKAAMEWLLSKKEPQLTPKIS